MEGDCLNCGRYETHYACAQCHVATYCSRECQLARLKNHGCKPAKRYIDTVNDKQWEIYLRNRFEQDFNGRIRVLRKEQLVYKFCKTEAEFLETIIFYEKHQEHGIVPIIFTVVDAAWLIVTYYVEGFITLGESVSRGVAAVHSFPPKDRLQHALIVALSKFRSNSFGVDLLANLSNIGYDGNDRIIFFENNGKIYSYRTKSEMIFQFLHLLKFKHPNIIGTVWSEETIKQYI